MKQITTVIVAGLVAWAVKSHMYELAAFLAVMGICFYIDVALYDHLPRKKGGHPGPAKGGTE